MIAPPYSTGGGRIVHARVQRINEPASWQIRSWDVLKRIAATIYVDKSSHKAIVIGAKGATLKRIGTEARHAMEHLFASRVHLDRVESLGHFLELEVVLAEGESPDAGVKEARVLMTALGLGDEQLVEGAYVDLLSQQSVTRSLTQGP